MARSLMTKCLAEAVWLRQQRRLAVHSLGFHVSAFRPSTSQVASFGTIIVPDSGRDTDDCILDPQQVKLNAYFRGASCVFLPSSCRCTSRRSCNRSLVIRVHCARSHFPGGHFEGPQARHDLHD